MCGGGPACGITSFVYPSGSTYTLVSVGNYASLGEQSSQRMVRGVGFVSTVRSILGLQHNDLPAAHRNSKRRLGTAGP